MRFAALAALVAITVGHAGAALPASETTQLIVLGTMGGPRVNADRAQSANLVVVNGVHYLIDAGNGVARQLSLVNVRPWDVRHIFITHNHDDHNADWGTLMGLAWSSGNYEPITVHGPRGTKSMLKGFLRYFAPNAAARFAEGAVNVKPADMMRAHEIRGAGLVYQDRNVRVTAVENCHFNFSPGTPGYGWQQSFAFRFQTPDRSIVFSGDTGPCGDVLSEFARDADILVHEVIDMAAIEARDAREAASGAALPKALREAHMRHMRIEHTSPQEIGRVASSAGVKLLVLSHVVPGRNSESNEAALLAGIKEHYSGEVILARDLTKL